jgi:bifunctional DNA-binding transcriptional regulator/antitoxin component of YhaV-PrlF toxin-antitoxin module
MELVTLNKRGQISIPRTILRRLGIVGEAQMLVDVTPQGVIELRPAAILPIETYSNARLKELEAENHMTQAERSKVGKALAKARKRA